jgi:hypothetical protein
LLHGNISNGYHAAISIDKNKRSTIEFGNKNARIGGGKIEDGDSYTEDDYNQTPDNAPSKHQS